MSAPLTSSSARLHAPADWLAATQIARVVSVRDPLGKGRVQVQLLAADPAGDAPIWARVATAFAGNDYGMHAVPDVGEEVLVVFVGFDSAHPVVVGALWNGATEPPDQFPGDAVDRWSLNGKAGTRIAIVEESSGQERIELLTPGGTSVVITDEGGGKIQCDVAGSTVTIDSSGMVLTSSAKVDVTASGECKITASKVSVQSAMADFSGVVKCTTLQATAGVISPSYTPGAGNIW